METIENLVISLTGKDNMLADANLRKLENISSGNDKVAAFIPSFLSMLESSNSFVRTRGLRLLVLNSNKDYGNLIEGHLSDLLNMLNDKSPIAVRQLLKSLPILAERRPDLKNQIIKLWRRHHFPNIASPWLHSWKKTGKSHLTSWENKKQRPITHLIGGEIETSILSETFR